MTSGIRGSWVQAIKKCMEDSAALSRASTASDSGMLHAHGATPDLVDSGAKVRATRILPVYQHLPQTQLTKEPTQFTDTAPTEKTLISSKNSRKSCSPDDSQLDNARLPYIASMTQSESQLQARHVRESSVDSIGEEIAKARSLEDKPPSPSRQDIKSKRKPKGLGTTRRHSNLEQSSTKSPIHKAPSAKLKERSRSKSPRPRSPPPDLPDGGQDDESFNSIVRRNTVTILPSYVAGNPEDDSTLKQVDLTICFCTYAT